MSNEKPLDRPNVDDGECWLNLNGWGEAGYMDGGREQEAECRLLRKNEHCAMHSTAAHAARMRTTSRRDH